MSSDTKIATVEQVMRKPTTIDSDAHLAAAAYEIEHHNAPALVVVTDTDEPVAMITSTEITRAVALGRNLEDTRVGQFVTAKVASARADASAEDAAELMLSQDVLHLPVVAADRRLVGMVDLRDLYRAGADSRRQSHPVRSLT